MPSECPFLTLRKKESKKDVVRDLLQILVKTAHPSFNTFWHLLDTEVEGGVGLRWQLFERRGTVPKAAAPHPSLIGVDHGRPEADGGHLQDQLGSTPYLGSFSAVPHVGIGGEANHPQSAEAAGASLQPDFAANKRDVQSDQTASASELLVIIEVVESLKDRYRPHAPTIRAAIRHYLAEAYSKNVYDNFLVLKEIFCEKLSRVKQREERVKNARTVAFATDVQPRIRIIFPNTDSAKYDPNHRMVEAHLRRIMRLKKSDLEIDVETGSITLIISIPGQGLINILIYFHQFPQPFNFLLIVDKWAKISFGELPYVSVESITKIDNLCPVKTKCLLEQTLMTSTAAHAFPTVEKTACTEKRRRLLTKCHGLYHYLDDIANIQSEVQRWVVTQTALQGKPEADLKLSAFSSTAVLKDAESHRDTAAKTLKSRRKTLISQNRLISSLRLSYFKSLTFASRSASQANFCQECQMHEDETKAELVCLSGCKRAYYCRDCWEYVHTRPKLRNHKYKRVSRAKVLDLMRNERIATLPKSHLPWKTLAPSLFQLFRVVVENADVEKVVVVEEELAGLCNTFTPNSCTLDCSKIDLDYLKALTLTPIGLVGDSIAIYGFLRSHFQFKDADYTKMMDPDVCPPGLYALMPNKAALFVFYWRSSRKTSDKEINRIACQMLKQVRDLCNEIVVCVENKTFLNSNFAQSPGRRISSNNILENFHTVFRKYPITNCYVRETKPLKITFVFPQQPNLHVSSGHFKFYFHSMLRALSSETGKHVDQLRKGMTVQTCSAEDFSNMFFSPCEPVRVGDFVLAVLTAVPIQIARVENNRLIPLTKEVNVSLAGSLTSTDNVNTILSFGVYEAVLRYTKAPAKVVSATGKQSVCKSFLINHMMGSLFDIADDRCTHGVWMAIKLYPDVTVIALDFEGFGSFERSSQEDVFMAIFGAAVSSLTVFKMALSLDEDTRHMFDCSKNGANHPTTDKTGNRRPNEQLAVVCKDVFSNDIPDSLNGILHELKVEVLKSSLGNSFVAEVYGENNHYLTSDTFEKEHSFASLDMLKEHLHDKGFSFPAEEKNLKLFDNSESNARQQNRTPFARNTAHIMKTALARISLPDWTAFIGTDPRFQQHQYDTENQYGNAPDGPTDIHFCTVRCPTCKKLCFKPHSHAGLHSTKHSNMGMSSDGTHQTGESTREETCDQHCKRLGRGHTHFLRCPGEHPPDDFTKKNVRHAARTSSNGDAFDEVTHEYYWNFCKFEDNCNDAERILYQKCDSVCEAVKDFSDYADESDSFCQLELWHPPFKEELGKEGYFSKDGHYFGCKHNAVAGYHVVLLIDTSFSMSNSDLVPRRDISLNNRLGAVVEMCDEFCERRCQLGTDFLTIITFDTKANVQCEGVAMPASISKIFETYSVQPQGATAFGPPLKQAKKSIEVFACKKAKNNEIIPLVILITDGECFDADHAAVLATSLKKEEKMYPTPTVLCVSCRDFGGEKVLKKFQVAERFTNSKLELS